MNNAFVIQWKNKVNGRAGKGGKVFRRDEALRLVQELNEEYPQILHEVVPAPPPKPEPEAVETGLETEEYESREAVEEYSTPAKRAPRYRLAAVR